MGEVIPGVSEQLPSNAPPIFTDGWSATGETDARLIEIGNEPVRIGYVDRGVQAVQGRAQAANVANPNRLR